MSTEKNVQAVKDFFAAISRGDGEGLLALVAEDVERIIPGADWPLAGTHRGHAGLSAVNGAGCADGRVWAGIARAACGHRFARSSIVQ